MTDRQTRQWENEMPEDALITPSQCRAARALLGLSQEELAAKARIAEKTVLRFERGEPRVRPTTHQALRMALERFGVVFLRGDGVARR